MVGMIHSAHQSEKNLELSTQMAGLKALKMDFYSTLERHLAQMLVVVYSEMRKDELSALLTVQRKDLTSVSSSEVLLANLSEALLELLLDSELEEV